MKMGKILFSKLLLIFLGSIALINTALSGNFIIKNVSNPNQYYFVINGTTGDTSIFGKLYLKSVPTIAPLSLLGLNTNGLVGSISLGIGLEFNNTALQVNTSEIPTISWVQANYYDKSTIDSWNLIKYYTLQNSLNFNNFGAYGIDHLKFSSRSILEAGELTASIVVDSDLLPVLEGIVTKTYGRKPNLGSRSQPWENLYIENSTWIEQTTYPYSNPSALYISTNTGDAISIFANATNRSGVYVTSQNPNTWTGYFEGGRGVHIDNLLEVNGSQNITKNLEVGGNAHINGDLTANGITYSRSFVDYDNTSYYLDLSNLSISLVTAGAVGINTTSPKYTLDVNGNIGAKAYVDTDSNPGLTLTILDDIENQDWNLGSFTSYSTDTYRSPTTSIGLHPASDLGEEVTAIAWKVFNLKYLSTGTVTIYYYIGKSALETFSLGVYDLSGNLLCSNHTSTSGTTTDWEPLSCSFSSLVKQINITLMITTSNTLGPQVYVDDVTITYKPKNLLVDPANESLLYNIRSHKIYTDELNANTKNAIIKSRLTPGKLIKTGAWEGPYYEILYRGRVMINGTSAKVYFPQDFREVTDGKNYDVFLTPIGTLSRVAWKPIYNNDREIIGFEVLTEKPCEVSYLVVGRRWDIQEPEQ